MAPRSTRKSSPHARTRHAGIEPTVAEYLKTPPSHEKLTELIAAVGIPVRALLRLKGTPHDELGLQDPRCLENSCSTPCWLPPDPDQPAHRRDACHHPAVPLLGGSARAASRAARPVCQGRWRAGHRRKRAPGGLWLGVADGLGTMTVEVDSECLLACRTSSPFAA